jgi:hypothetical protein
LHVAFCLEVVQRCLHAVCWLFGVGYTLHEYVGISETELAGEANVAVAPSGDVALQITRCTMVMSVIDLWCPGVPRLKKVKWLVSDLQQPRIFKYYA